MLTIVAAVITRGIESALTTFSGRFENVFKPQAPFGGDGYIECSKAMLANLLGGIGYFYGNSRTDTSNATEYQETVVPDTETYTN